MKNTKNIVSSLVIAAVISTAGSVIALADDSTTTTTQTTTHKDVTYTHDDQGWYDENHTRHDFETVGGHRGYYNYANGQRVWFSIDSAPVISVHP